MVFSSRQIQDSRWKYVWAGLLFAAVHSAAVLADPEDPPRLLTPSEGIATFLPFPHFTWEEAPESFQSVAEPVAYDIQIARDANFTDLVDQDHVMLNRYVHDRPLAVGSYFWRVRTQPFSRQPGNWSLTGTFSITPCDDEVTVEYDPEASDHFAAVQTALDRARKITASNQSVRIVFPKGVYRFDGSDKALLNLDNMHRTVVDGCGSSVLPLRYNSGLSSGRSAQDVVIIGFVVDFPNEKTFLQGRVVSADPKTGQVEVRLDDGFPGYDVPYVQQGLSFIALLDSKTDGCLKTAGYNAVFSEKAALKNPSGTWTLKLRHPELAKYFSPDDRFVQFLRDQGVSLNMFFDSINVSFYDISSYAASSLHYAAIEGSVLNVLHCNWKIAMGRWMSGNGDGVHCRGYVIGPWIERCDIQGIGDDGIALYARPSTMAQARPNGKKNACVCNSDFFNLKAGDEVSFFAPLEGRILLECQVTAVKKQPDGKPLVTFSSDLPEHVVVGHDIRKVTQIWNRSKSSGDFMIRNNRIRNIRRFGTVFRARRGVVEHNEYESASAGGILFKNEPQYPNGLYCSDILILNNTLRDCSFDLFHRAPVAMYFDRLRTGNEFDTQAAPEIGPRRVLIANNTFLDCPLPEVELVSTRDVVLRDNTVRRGNKTEPLQVRQENTHNVTR